MFIPDYSVTEYAKFDFGTQYVQKKKMNTLNSLINE